jgi:hypothetical protein
MSGAERPRAGVTSTAALVMRRCQHISIAGMLTAFESDVPGTPNLGRRWLLEGSAWVPASLT